MNRLTALARRRWPAIALVASLVLNGFLAGMIVAGAFAPHHKGRPGSRIATFELRRLADRLPRQAVEAIAADLRAQRPEVDARVQRMRAIRADIGAAAAMPQPDRALIDAKLADLREEAAALQEEVQRATYDALLKMPPDVRAPLAGAGRPG